MLDDDTTEMTAELRDELASNERRSVDPRSLPLRFHWLRAMAQSPAHALEAAQDQRPDTLALRLGSGTHAIMFDKPIAVWTGKVRNGKVWDAFRDSHAGSVILNRKEHAKALAIANSLRRSDTAMRLLASPGVLRESTIEWTWNGRKCQSTPDARSPYSVVELKTARSSEPGRFARDATFRGYHAQLAWYRLAIEATVGVKPPDAYIVAVESAPPHTVTVLRLTPRALERGEQLVRTWFERVLVSESSNDWPGYCESVADFDVPDDEVELVFGDDDAEDE